MGLTINTRVIKKFKHRVLICSQDDVVIDNSGISLIRKGIYEAWAMIEPKKPSTFGIDGSAVLDPTKNRTHVIVTRFRSDIDVTASAWIYEKRLKSPARWFKILSFVDENEDSEYFAFTCRVMEAGEGLTEPVDARLSLAVPLPNGVSI